jgi:hypothetical protein
MNRGSGPSMVHFLVVGNRQDRAINCGSIPMYITCVAELLFTALIAPCTNEHYHIGRVCNHSVIFEAACIDIASNVRHVGY